MLEGKASFSPDSVLCGQALGSTIVRTSRACGWTSVLLDHHRIDAPAYDVFETLATPDQTIVVMLSGEQEIEAYGAGGWRRALYRAGTIGMTPGGHVDRLRRRPRAGQRAFEKANLYLPQELFREAGDHYRRAGQPGGERQLTSLAFHDTMIVQTVASLLRGMRAGLPDIYAETAACWIATHLMSQDSGWLGADVRAGRMSDRRLSGVRDLIGARFAEPLTLEDLAAEAGISKFHFARLFRERMGTTPHAYVLQVRIEAACRLLTETDLRLKQIAAQCGFPRAASLASAFVHRLGVTPSAFRQGVRRMG